MNIEFLDFLIEVGANLVADINKLSKDKIRLLFVDFNLLRYIFLITPLDIIVPIPLTSEAVKFLAASSNPKYSP